MIFGKLLAQAISTAIVMIYSVGCIAPIAVPTPPSTPTTSELHASVRTLETPTDIPIPSSPTLIREISQEQQESDFAELCRTLKGVESTGGKIIGPMWVLYLWRNRFGDEHFFSSPNIPPPTHVPNALLCVMEREVVLETCSYIGHDVTRIRYEAIATLIGIEEKQKIAEKSFLGTEPELCPASISLLKSAITGQDVREEEVLEWASSYWSLFTPPSADTWTMIGKWTGKRQDGSELTIIFESNGGFEMSGGQELSRGVYSTNLSADPPQLALSFDDGQEIELIFKFVDNNTLYIANSQFTLDYVVFHREE